MDHSAWQADISLLNRLPFSSGSKNADETCSKMLQLQEVLYLPKEDSERAFIWVYLTSRESPCDLIFSRMKFQTALLRGMEEQEKLDFTI